MKNRISNGMMYAGLLFPQGEENALMGHSFDKHSTKSNKMTQASTTLLRFDKLPQIFLLETNVMYFDEPAMMPQVITARLSYGSRLGFSSWVPEWSTPLEVNMINRKGLNYGF